MVASLKCLSNIYMYIRMYVCIAVFVDIFGRKFAVGHGRTCRDCVDDVPKRRNVDDMRFREFAVTFATSGAFCHVSSRQHHR